MDFRLAQPPRIISVVSVSLLKFFVAGAVNVKALALLTVRVDLSVAHRDFVRVQEILRVHVVLSVGLHFSEGRVVARGLSLVGVGLVLVYLEAADVSVVVLPSFLVALVRRAFVGSETIRGAGVLSLAVILMLEISVVIPPNLVRAFGRAHKTFFKHSPRLWVIDHFCPWNFVSGSLFVREGVFHRSGVHAAVVNRRPVVIFWPVFHEKAPLFQRIFILVSRASGEGSVVVRFLFSPCVLSLISIHVFCLRDIVSAVRLARHDLVDRLLMVVASVGPLIRKIHNLCRVVVSEGVSCPLAGSLILNLVIRDLSEPSFRQELIHKIDDVLGQPLWAFDICPLAISKGLIQK